MILYGGGRKKLTTPREDFVGELRLGKELTSVIQILGVSLNIGLGLIVFYSSLVLPEVGKNTGVIILGAALALGLTLLSVIELIGGMGESGGSYQIVYEIIHRSLSFLTGWAIVLGSLALGAGLALMAAEVLNSVLNLPSPVFLTALALLLILLIFQLFQFLPRRIQSWLLGGILAVFLVVAVVTQETPQATQVAFSRAVSSQPVAALATSTAIICGCYIIFESLLSVRRQIRNPVRLLPRGLVYTFALWFSLALVIFQLLESNAQTFTGESPFLVNLIRNYSFLPDVLAILLVLLLLLIAAHGCLMVAARQIAGLVRTGGLPTWLREVRRPFPMPVFMFLTMGLLLIPLAILGTDEMLAALAAGLFLGVMCMLNVAAIRSQRSEPNRRRTINIPFSPLLPATAIGFNLILLRYLPTTSIIVGALWVILGVAVYFLYARRHLVEVKIESSTFGRLAEMDENEAQFRILVPIGPGTERNFTLNTAITLARQIKGEVLPLQVVTLSDPLAIEQGRRTARERNTLFSWSVRTAKTLGVPVFPITRLSRSVYDGILETAEEEDCNLILIPWEIQERLQGVRIGQAISQVVRRASCDVAVLAFRPTAVNGPENGTPEGEKEETVDSEGESDSEAGFHRILVPTSGGPNAPLAVQLAVMLARETDAQVTALYVTTKGATQEELAEGQRRIENSIDTMLEMAEDIETGHPLAEIHKVAVEGEVIQADSIVSGIAETASERDLILLGVSEESVIDQVLFGTIPEQVAAESPAPVMLVKRYRGLPRMWFNRFLQSIFRSVPKLNTEEQIEVYRNIHRGSRPSIDYFIMISLSSIIATFGLFLNSTAVIIGAMLVAPLFSPIIGLGLSVTLGNVRLLRLAIEATLKGIALAIGMAIVVTLLSRSEGLTPEILARTQPSLLDMGVAIASGAAGAYAVARKGVATALPGVAIAAALVPPLSVVGIGIAYGDPQVALGSGLLFLTNLVSIVLAGSIVFLLLGFRPGGEQVREHHFQRALSVTITLFILVLIPLGYFFVQSARTAEVNSRIETIVIEETSKFEEIDLISSQTIVIERDGDNLIVNVPISAEGPSVEAYVNSLTEALNNASPTKVHVRALVLPVIESPSLLPL